MLDIAVLAGIGVSFASVLLVFGCVCQLFKKSPPGFSVSLFCPTLYHLCQVTHNLKFFILKNSRFLKRKKNSNLYNCNTSSLSYRYFSCSRFKTLYINLILILYRMNTTRYAFPYVT